MPSRGDEESRLPIDDIRTIARMSATVEELRRLADQTQRAHEQFSASLTEIRDATAANSSELARLLEIQQSQHSANQAAIAQLSGKIADVASKVDVHESERQQEIGQHRLRTWLIGLISSGGGGGVALALSKILGGGSPPGH